MPIVRKSQSKPTLRPPAAPRTKSAEFGTPVVAFTRPRGEEVTLADRRQQAMELRRGGSTYRAIAAAIGVTVHTAHDYVQAELREIREATKEDTEAIRDIELQRCDQMLKGLEAGINAGDPQSVMAALKAAERRARLLGLDAPTKSMTISAVITPEDAAKLSEEEILAKLNELVASAKRVALPPGTVVEAEVVAPDEDDDDT